MYHSLCLYSCAAQRLMKRRWMPPYSLEIVRKGTLTFRSTKEVAFPKKEGNSQIPWWFGEENIFSLTVLWCFFSAKYWFMLLLDNLQVPIIRVKIKTHRRNISGYQGVSFLSGILLWWGFPSLLWYVRFLQLHQIWVEDWMSQNMSMQTQAKLKEANKLFPRFGKFNLPGTISMIINVGHFQPPIDKYREEILLDSWKL